MRKLLLFVLLVVSCCRYSCLYPIDSAYDNEEIFSPSYTSNKTYYVRKDETIRIDWQYKIDSSHFRRVQFGYEKDGYVNDDVGFLLPPYFPIYMKYIDELGTTVIIGDEYLILKNASDALNDCHIWLTLLYYSGDPYQIATKKYRMHIGNIVVLPKNVEPREYMHLVNRTMEKVVMYYASSVIMAICVGGALSILFVLIVNRKFLFKSSSSSKDSSSKITSSNGVKTDESVEMDFKI